MPKQDQVIGAHLKIILAGDLAEKNPNNLIINFGYLTAILTNEVMVQFSSDLLVNRCAQTHI